MTEPEFRQIGHWIADALDHRSEPDRLARIRRQVLEMAEMYPLYKGRRERHLAGAKA